MTKEPSASANDTTREIDDSDDWTEEDMREFTAYSMRRYIEREEAEEADFPATKITSQAENQ